MNRCLLVANIMLAIATPLLLSNCQAADRISTTPRSAAGTLRLQVNGEDFIQQTFVSKDGWQIQLAEVHVNLGDVTAYQAPPAASSETVGPLTQAPQVKFQTVGTIALRPEPPAQSPIPVGEVSAPIGHYNALNWQLVRASDGPYAGQTLVMIGKATKANQTFDFDIRLDTEYSYQCGEFVGDQRKGVVKAGQTAEVEATFHFDHIFGDDSLPQTDAVNQGALGFTPLVALATDQRLVVNSDMLKTRLSPQASQTLETALHSLGHVGEGHCRAEEISPP